MTIQVGQNVHIAMIILVKNTNLKKFSTTSTMITSITIIRTMATSTTVTSITVTNTTIISIKTIKNIDTVNLSMTKSPRIVLTKSQAIASQQLMRRAIIVIVISINIMDIIMALMIMAHITSPSNLKIQSKKEISMLRLLAYIFLETC